MDVCQCDSYGKVVATVTGMDMINESVEWQYHKVPAEKWMFVSVAIAPSTITITEHGVSLMYCPASVMVSFVSVQILWRRRERGGGQGWGGMMSGGWLNFCGIDPGINQAEHLLFTPAKSA